MKEYVCPVCGRTMKVEGNVVHNHYLNELSKELEERGYKVIQEGKMPERIKGWHEPDMFVLKEQSLAKVVEIIVQEGYRQAYEKAKKIKRYYNPPEIIIFEPVKFLDAFYLPRRKNYYKKRYLGYEPKSYSEIEKYFTNTWRKKGLDVIFWNETNIG